MSFLAGLFTKKDKVPTKRRSTLLQRMRDAFSMKGASRSIPLTREHLDIVTPKHARAHARSENRFRRAMNRPEIPVVKKAHVEEFCRQGVPAEALVKVHENHLAYASNAWEPRRLFTRKRSKRLSDRSKREQRVEEYKKYKGECLPPSLPLLGGERFVCEGGNPVATDGGYCEAEKCQACCPHDEFEHDQCLACDYERDPGTEVDNAEYLVDTER